jgi:hypothetical protein
VPPLAAQQNTTPLDSSAGRIMFSVAESFADAAGRTHLVLRVGTERKIRCYAPLGGRVTTRGDTIIVDRWHLAITGICLDDADEAPSGAITLPLEEGRRVLAIAHVGAVDRYRLTVTSDAIRVAPIGTPRVSVLGDTTLLWRFPRNSLALTCGTGASTAWTCAEVEHLLADEPGLVPIEIPAGGRNPYSTWRGDYGVAEPVRYFRVATTAGYDRFLRDVRRLHDAYAGRRAGFDVSILRWTGARWSIGRSREDQSR